MPHKMNKSPWVSSRRIRSGSRMVYVFFLMLVIAGTAKASEGTCSASDSCQKAPSTSSTEDINHKEYGAFVFVAPIYHPDGPGACKDEAKDCEEFIDEHFSCLLNPDEMREVCPKSCYVCFENGEGSNNSLVKVPIGKQQTLPVEATEEEKLRFDEVVSETASYMVDEVFAKKEFEEARRECRNFVDHCAWKVASTNGTFCDEPKSQRLCGPACKACGEIILTEEEHEMLDECRIDNEKNIFVDIGDDDFDDSRTLDAMFRRIVGELPYPSSSEDPYPIVPGVNYTVKVLSRPSLNPDIHTNMSWDLIDFYIGGSWIVVLDDFLTPEECDRMIELGDRLGRKKSTIEDEEEEEEEEDEGEERPEKDKISDEPSWRTSTTAWCNKEICDSDPIAKRIHERIGYTTGVTDQAYYEDFQLLKYETGQYYKDHHDIVGNYHDNIYAARGPRVLTFFLYLNDVEEGGETRFTDLLGDDTDIYLDVQAKKGRALLWPSVFNEDLLMMDTRTYHEAREVKKGQKFGANVWMYLRDYKNSECDDDSVEELLQELKHEDFELSQ